MLVRICTVWLAAASMVLVGAGALFVPPIADAQPPPSGAELRLAARVNSDGSICVGVQWRENNRWRGTTPRRCLLPSDATEGVWYASSTVPVPMARVEVELRAGSPRWFHEEAGRSLILSAGNREWRIDRLHRLFVTLEHDTLSFKIRDHDTGDLLPLAAEIGREATGEGTQLVRLLGRRTAGDAIELGLQRLIGRDWQPIEQPAQAIVTLSRANRWAFTEPFITPLMPPVFRGALRSGATIDTVDGRIQVTVDGQTMSSQCGVLGFQTSVTIGVVTRNNDCESEVMLFSICSEGVPDSECDFQQFQVYNWEDRHTGPAHIELTDEEMVRIVQAVYADYVVGKRPPAVAQSEYVGNSHWSSEDHTVYMWETHRYLKVLLHETAHAIVDGLNRHDAGHGASFAALNLSVFSRYAPLVDARAMRQDAERVGVLIANWTPRPVSDNGIDVVRRLICDLGEDAEAMCDAFDNQAAALSTSEVEGGSTRSGRLDDLYWNDRVRLASGSLWSSVTKEQSVNLRGEEPARLRLTCSDDHGPRVEIWWPGEAALSEEIEYQVGSLGWISERWIASPAPWGERTQQRLLTYDPRQLAAQLGWAASAGLPWSIRLVDDRQTHELSFELDRFFDTPAQAHLALCLFQQQPSAGRFVGSGGLPGGRYWAALDDAGLLYSRAYVDARLTSHPDKIARLEVSCDTADTLNVRVWWRGLDGVDPLVEYGIGDARFEQARWHVGSGNWGEDVAWAFVRAPNSLQLVQLMAWRAAAGESLQVSAQADGETFAASFPLNHLFEAPVQGNLSRCGASKERSEPDAPVIDHGRSGDDFWWSVVENDDPLRTYVATQTTIVDEGDRVSRMQISCAENTLRLSVYWDVPRDLDGTVSYLVEGETVRAEWNTWTSTWHDGEFKGIGAPARDSADLIRQLAWTAQSGGTFTVEVHERGNANRRYTAMFDLDGLFDTPVQPNLARCGR